MPLSFQDKQTPPNPPFLFRSSVHLIPLILLIIYLPLPHRSHSSSSSPFRHLAYSPPLLLSSLPLVTRHAPYALMMLISQKHIATLAPYDDFTFALATPPSSSSSSFSSSSAESPIHSTPAVTYHDLTRSPTPANHRTIREVGATRRVHFTTFLLQDSGHAHSAATAPAPTSVSREDLVHALSLLLRRYADAADLAAEVLEAMSEPLGKPHAAWCMGIHRSVREVVKRRLEIVRESGNVWRVFFKSHELWTLACVTEHRVRTRI